VSVFNDRNADIGERMDALKIARKAEAPKVTPKIIRLEVKDRGERECREAWRHWDKSQLKMRIYQATGNTPPLGWADHLTGDDYVPPPGDEWPPWCKKA